MTVGINGVSDVIKKSLLTTIGDIIAASAVSTPARIAAPASGQVLTGQGAGVLPAWAAAAVGAVTLLKANSGTSTAGVATSVDSYAMASGLTALDSLLIVFGVSALTQPAAAPVQLYFTTDATNGPQFNSGAAVAAGSLANGFVLMRQTQHDNTRYEILLFNSYGGTGGGLGNTAIVSGGSNGIMTAWTGAWTLALRHGGVSGGTFRWSWAIYKIAGQ